MSEHEHVGQEDCVACNGCGFTYAAVHTNENGYTCPVCEDEPAARREGAAEERARVVAWLRGLGDGHRDHPDVAVAEWLARHIEDGDHVK